MHAPMQALAQQTPCSQNPELHSLLAAQLVPTLFAGWHFPD